MNNGLCILIDANHYFLCKNNRRDVATDVHTRLGEVGINSSNIVHNNVVHTMGVSKPDQAFGQVLLAWMSGALAWTK